MSISASSWLKFGLFTVGLGQSFVFVLVPPLARELGLSEIQTSLIFAISAFAWALTSAFWGRASDRYGRRNIAILGLVGYAISLIALITPLFLVERNILDLGLLFPALILGRLINGLVGSATRPASFAYVADISSREQRTVKFARLESSFLLGTVLGPLIGGFLFLITKETPFYVFSFLAFVAAFGIFLDGNDVYLAGYTTGSLFTFDIGCKWTNGNLHELSSNVAEDQQTWLYDIAVANDVKITVGFYYTVITDYNDPLYYDSPIFPCYYRNGQRVNLEEAEWQLGEATGVFIE